MAMLGAFFAVLSALTFALNNATMRRGVLSGSVGQAMLLTLPIGAVLSIVAVLAIGAWPALARFETDQLGWLAVAGLIHFVIGRYGNYRATKAIGANLVSPIQETSLVWSIGLAVLVMGEVLSWQAVAGILLISLGPMVALRRSRTGPAPVPDVPAAPPPAQAFTPQYLEGYTFAIISSISYGVTPVMIANAMPAGAGLAEGMVANAVSYCAAALALLLVFLIPGRWSAMTRIEPVALRWFTYTGLLVGVSHMMRYMALAIAPVSVVTPVQRTAIIFRLVFARLINPQHEIFGGGIVAAAACSLAGVILLTVKTATLAQFLPIPAALAAFLSASPFAGP